MDPMKTGVHKWSSHEAKPGKAGHEVRWRNTSDDGGCNDPGAKDATKQPEFGPPPRERRSPLPGNKPIAVSPNDPRSIMRFFRNLQPKGNNRGKIELLRQEIRHLKLKDNPIAFCFLLRSMFEIAAKTFCDNCTSENAPKYKKVDGEERKLADVLNDIYIFLTNGTKDKVKVKELHGAITELKKEHGLLSVTSMNQLVHNPKFSITETDISSLFGNISPLLLTRY
jgi:hypothetical protein